MYALSGAWSQNSLRELADLVEVYKVNIVEIWYEERVCHLTPLVKHLSDDVCRLTIFVVEALRWYNWTVLISRAFFYET